ncbi:MAG: adenosine-specific kinase [Candidatus Micrarchaeaceae archaeon]
MPKAELSVYEVKKESDMQLIIGHAGFIKTAEDLYEAIISSTPNVKFGLAFIEASGPCLVRSEGNDSALTKLAEENALGIGAGHTFIILFREAFPINVLNAIKAVPEVARVYCATANPVQVLTGSTGLGKAIVGVIDGSAAKGIESSKDKSERRALLRHLGYKLQ